MMEILNPLLLLGLHEVPAEMLSLAVFNEARQQWEQENMTRDWVLYAGRPVSGRSAQLALSTVNSLEDLCFYQALVRETAFDPILQGSWTAPLDVVGNTRLWEDASFQSRLRALLEPFFAHQILQAVKFNDRQHLGRLCALPFSGTRLDAARCFADTIAHLEAEARMLRDVPALPGTPSYSQQIRAFALDIQEGEIYQAKTLNLLPASLFLPCFNTFAQALAEAARRCFDAAPKTAVKLFSVARLLQCSEVVHRQVEQQFQTCAGNYSPPVTPTQVYQKPTVTPAPPAKPRPPKPPSYNPPSTKAPPYSPPPQNKQSVSRPHSPNRSSWPSRLVSEIVYHLTEQPFSPKAIMIFGIMVCCIGLGRYLLEKAAGSDALNSGPYIRETRPVAGTTKPQAIAPEDNSYQMPTNETRSANIQPIDERTRPFYKCNNPNIVPSGWEKLTIQVKNTSTDKTFLIAIKNVPTGAFDHAELPPGASELVNYYPGAPNRVLVFECSDWKFGNPSPCGAVMGFYEKVDNVLEATMLNADQTGDNSKFLKVTRKLTLPVDVTNSNGQWTSIPEKNKKKHIFAFLSNLK